MSDYQSLAKFRRLWLIFGRRIDYYGVTFDHLVPVDDQTPEVLQINMTEIEYDGGQYVDDVLRFTVNHTEYTGRKVLAVPRCCQLRRGTTDRRRVNDSVFRTDTLRAQGPVYMTDDDMGAPP